MKLQHLEDYIAQANAAYFAKMNDDTNRRFVTMDHVWTMFAELPGQYQAELCTALRAEDASEVGRVFLDAWEEYRRIELGE